MLATHGLSEGGMPVFDSSTATMLQIYEPKVDVEDNTSYLDEIFESLLELLQ